jgi:hypothetical protein
MKLLSNKTLMVVLILISGYGCKKDSKKAADTTPDMIFVADERHVHYSGYPTSASEFIGVGLYNYGGSDTSYIYAISGGIDNTDYMLIGFTGPHPLTKSNINKVHFNSLNYSKNGAYYVCTGNCTFNITISDNNLLSGTFTGALYTTSFLELIVNAGSFQNVAITP